MSRNLRTSLISLLLAAGAYSGAVQAERETVLQRLQGRTGPRTLILVSAGQGTQAATANSFTGNLVKMLGGQNIADEKDQAENGLIKLDQEFIAQADPAWQTVSAVQKGRVYPLPHELFNINPGMCTGEAMDILSHALYPDIPR